MVSATFAGIHSSGEKEQEFHQSRNMKSWRVVTVVIQTGMNGCWERPDIAPHQHCLGSIAFNCHVSWFAPQIFFFRKNFPILKIPKVISGKRCRKTQYFRTVSPKVKQPNPIGLIVETQGHESLFTIKRLWEMGAWSGSVLTKLPKKKMGIYHRILGFNQQFQVGQLRFNH